MLQQCRLRYSSNHVGDVLTQLSGKCAAIHIKPGGQSCTSDGKVAVVGEKPSPGLRCRDPPETIRARVNFIVLHLDSRGKTIKSFEF